MRVEQSIILFAIGAATYFVYKYVFKKEDPVKKRGAEMGCFQSRSDDAEPEVTARPLQHTSHPYRANVFPLAELPWVGSVGGLQAV